MSFKNYYIILGIKNTANSEEIKQAFRKLAKKYHPDKNHGNNSAEDFFKEVQEAYAVLSDQEKRKKYDLRFAYSNSYQRVKHKSHAPYTGNAYPYAQQQAKHEGRRQAQQEQSGKEPVKENKSGTDPYLFMISIIVAILLLLFIVFYASK